MKAAKVFATSLKVLVSGLGILAAGILLAYVCAAIAGAKVKLFGIIQGVPFDNVAMILATVVLFASTLAVYISKRRKAVREVAGSMRTSASYNAVSKHAYTTLFGTLALMFVLGAVLLFALG